MCIDLFPRNPRKRRSLHTSGFLQGRSKRRRSLFPGFTLTDSWTCAIEKTWLGVVKPFGCHSLTWIVKTIVWKLVWSYVSVPRSIFFLIVPHSGNRETHGWSCAVCPPLARLSECLQGANLRCSAIQWAMKLKIGSISIPLLNLINGNFCDVLVFPQDKEKRSLFHSCRHTQAYILEVWRLLFHCVFVWLQSYNSA